MSKRIELDAPCLGALEKKYLCEAVDSSFVSSVGPFISKFEQKIADYLHAGTAVAVQSGTSAIYMALHVLGIGPGDEVIVPSLTFVATVNAVLYAGAVPVIVDVDPLTWNMDPNKVKGAITAKTKAIVPVHVYGNPCDMDAIMRVAKEHGLRVVEDATESLGATFNGRHTGTCGHFGCFSFNGNKLITTGGGGMVVGHDQEQIERIRYLVNQAKNKDRPGFHAEMGFNYRMTNIEAALGLAQFEQIGAFLKKKKAFKEIYQDVLGPLGYVHFQGVYPNASHSFWLTCMTVKKDIDMTGVIRYLLKDHIHTRRIFIPLDQMPYLGTHAACPVASAIHERGMCLPSSMLNEEKDIQEAAFKIREVLW